MNQLEMNGAESIIEGNLSFSSLNKSEILLGLYQD